MEYRVRRAARVVGVGILVLGLVGPAGAADKDESPAGVVESLHSGLIELSSAPETLDVDTRYQRLRPLIERTHDLPYIAKFSVGRYWNDLSAEERAQFVSTFEKLSVMTYASRFVHLDSNTFETGDVEDLGNGRMEVTTSVRRNDGSTIPLDYILTEHDGRWRIINIVADGVSDLALKRAEYQQLLEEGSFADLEQHLERQISALEERTPD